MNHIVLMLLLCLWLSMEVQAATMTYTYDSLERLSSVQLNNGIPLRYTYDNAGNILSVKSESYTLPDVPYELTVLNKNTGDVLISATGISPYLGSNGTAWVNGENVSSDWMSDGVKLNIFEVNGLSNDVLMEPLKLQLFDADGNEIFNGCYPFVDVCPGVWYARPTMKLWRERVLEGYESGRNGVFGPMDPARRAELVAVVVRAIELGNTYTRPETPPFADVSVDDWFAAFVKYAKNQELIQGCNIDRNLFCPNDFISRAAAAKVISLGLSKTELDAIRNGQEPLWLFDDVQVANKWFYEFVYTMQIAHATHGYVPDGQLFKPEQDLSRAEMVKMVCIARFGPLECYNMDEPNAL